MSRTDAARPLDPEQLDPEAMDTETYHAVVGPALQVAAEIAAKRGHPLPHDDMPAMLALVEMVTRLADMFADAHPDHPVARELLDNAATGACVMVFQEAKMPADAVGQCLAALETAYRQLHEQNVLASARPFIAMAGSYIEDNDRVAARHCLEQATRHVIAAIEAWQDHVH